MNSLFGDYTSQTKGSIEASIKRVNSLALSCQNITKDQNTTIVELNGRVQRITLEKQAFIAKTEEFRRRLRNGESIYDIKEEALAVVREATARRLHMTPYDTQIEAALAMLGSEPHERVIAEMKTGEGKTLVQILVAYLNILEATKDEDRSKWANVHIMTSNDALAKRDANANTKVFDLLGLSCGFVGGRSANMRLTPAELAIYKHRKQQAYNCDIVYSTATTIAFDYLDDNTIYDVSQRNINRPFGYAIIDEADDILIDQATNPLRLTSRLNPNANGYEKALFEEQQITREVYKWATEFLYGANGKKGISGRVFDQYFKNKEVEFDELYAYYSDDDKVLFSERLEKLIGKDLDPNDFDTYNRRTNALMQCIRARHAFRADVQYRVEVGENNLAKIVIIDENVGRKRYLNKYTEGIQEAIEAKEEYIAQKENRGYHMDFSTTSVLKAMCTYPDFLNIYRGNVAGMTGTSDEEEFNDLYGFSTYRVRTRKRNIRIDEEDELYATTEDKYNRIIEEIIRCQKTGQPVLIGTTSLKESMILSNLLKKHFIRHQLLNANNESEENEIIQTAGLMGSVTVSTNMAGRGTDIKLGPGVKELGGLYVIGTSKNKSQRIDLQLRGRAGRQGDPGKTKYFMSLEDELVRENYGGKSIDAVIKLNKGHRIRAKHVINLVNRAQQRRASIDKKIRLDNEKLNIHYMSARDEMYTIRNSVLEANDKTFMRMIMNISSKYANLLVDDYSEEEMVTLIGHLVDISSVYSKDKQVFKQNLSKALLDNIRRNFDRTDKKKLDAQMKEYVKKMKYNFLTIMDDYWLDYVASLDTLRKSVSTGLEEDPFKKYETESQDRFYRQMLPAIFNEMFTYASNPNMKMGEYVIKYPSNDVGAVL